MILRTKHIHANSINFRLLLSVLLAIIFSTGLTAQTPELSVNAPSQVIEGQQFRVVFTINADGQNFSGPGFKGFSVLSGPNPSTRSNIQMDSRGQMIRSFTKSFTYFLLANQIGTFTIGAASISVDGQSYSSKPLTVQVVKGQGQGQGQGRQGNARQNARQHNRDQIGEDDVFLRAIVNKKDPYLGEEVIITYRIYTNRQINLPNNLQQPSFPGFWTEDLLKNENQYQQREETYNGKKYVAVDYKKVALFSQKSGEVRIDPFEMEVVARIQAQRRSGDPFFDNFFGGSFFNSYQNVNVKIRSNPVVLNVKPLPNTGKPANFSGAVGQFAIEASADKNAMMTNDALTINYTLSGSGNIMLVDAPQVIFPPDFETYDPKVSDRISANRSGVSGKRSFEFLAIARAPGVHEIKPVSFSYFDPESEKYVSLQTPSFSIEVEKGEGSLTEGGSSVSQEDVRFIGSDIRYIKSNNIKLRERKTPLLFSRDYLIFITLPLALFILILIVWRKRIAFLQDQSAVRNKRATRLARKQLRKARSLLNSGNKEGYYEAISQALWGYLGDKFNLPLSDLTMDTISMKLTSKGMTEDDIRKLAEIIESAEYARYAPSGVADARQDIYDRSLEIISKLENHLKS